MAASVVILPWSILWASLGWEVANGEAQGSQLVILGVTFAVLTAASVWCGVLLSKTLGEVHEFSAWRGLCTILASSLLAGLLLALVVLGIAAVRYLSAVARA